MRSTRGWGPWRYDWYSICSAHREPNEDCQSCRGGMWRNNWARLSSSAVYKVAPRLWRWWVNR